MKGVRKLHTSYIRGQYIFECLDDKHFAAVLKAVNQASSDLEALQACKKLTIDNKPAVRIHRVDWTFDRS